MVKTCPWRQTARKMPEVKNNPSIFFCASGPAFFHLSTQIGKLGINELPGSEIICNQSSSSTFDAKVVAAPSCNLSTSTGVIHLGDSDVRSSVRGFPVRKDESIYFNELLPSIAANIENFKLGSSIT